MIKTLFFSWQFLCQIFVKFDMSELSSHILHYFSRMDETQSDSNFETPESHG